MGKYSRVDGKKSSGYGLTITIVLIVSLSMVGAWMFMSSWSAPTESIDFSSSQTTKDVETTTKTDSTNEEASKSLPDEKNEETEVVKESNEEKPDPEKTEEAEEKKEFEDKNGEGDRKDGEGEKEAESESDETKQKEKTQLEESSEENKSEDGNKTEENTEENTEKKTEETEENTEKSKDVFPSGDQAEITKESSTGSGAWSTQLVESQNEKKTQVSSIKWKVCNVTAGPDYIPCLDNWQAIRKLARKHYEHRERHCPEESPTCLVPLPEGYKRSIKWPKSREKVKLLEFLLYVYLSLILMFCVFCHTDMVQQCSSHEASRSQRTSELGEDEW